jgi:hypothetical protein
MDDVARFGAKNQMKNHCTRHNFPATGDFWVKLGNAIK